METNLRSFLKAVSYRVFASTVTGGIVFGLTNKGWLAVGVGVGEFISKIGIFYLHERVWMFIPFGRHALPEKNELNLACPVTETE